MLRSATTLSLAAAVLCGVLPSPAAAQAFGGTVLIADGHILVGEAAHEREPGTVWVFARDGDEWVSVASLTGGSEAMTRDRFGQALARVDDHVFVGAGGVDGGAVYQYPLADLASWNGDAEAALWVSHGPEIATVLAGSGTELMVGMGRRVDGRLELEMIPVAEDGITFPGRSFNLQIGGLTPYALDAEILVVGNPGEGVARVYERPDGDGAWELTASLSPPGEPDERALFGSSLAVAGDEILVGQMRAGVVHRYARVDGSWQRTGTLEPEDDEMRPGYGTSLAADGETLLVGGARQFFAYRRSGADWVLDGASPLYDSDGAATPLASLSLEGRTAVLADPSADFGLGAVDVFSSESGEWAHAARLVADRDPLPAISGGEVACEDGEAAGYDCDHVDLLAFVPWEELGAARGARLNDVWGWTDSATGREYAIVCLMDGTSFVDVTDPSNPRFLGNLPMTPGSRANTWRDAKVFNNHAFVVADGAGEHGMQVFDLTRLRDVTEPATFEADALYTGIASSHNVAINEATGFAYLVGSSGEESCGGGSHMVDINDPLNPVFAGCFAHPNTGRRMTGNSHDTQCVIYHGPDEDYRGREICVNSNETALSVADVTDKANPVAISSADYPNVAYAHQGWLTEDHRYFYSNDELDEVSGLVEATRTLVWDLQDLDDPLLLTEYFSDTQATDHNLYIRGDRLYMTNNRAGLRVLDISDPENPVEVGHFDTTPWSADESGFDGTWSVYPYFESGTVLLSSRREGLFIVRPMARRLIP